MAARDYGEYGGITRALEIVGERWAMHIVRDLLVGPRRYGELAASLARIPSNILATRLKELQAAGVIRRAPRSRVIVYELTPFGRELEAAVLALDAWGLRAMGDRRAQQIITAESLTVDLRAAFQPRAAEGLPPTAYAAHLGTTALHIRVEGHGLDISRDAAAADLEFVAGPAVHGLIAGRLDPEAALATGAVELLAGPPVLLERFARTFRAAA